MFPLSTRILTCPKKKGHDLWFTLGQFCKFSLVDGINPEKKVEYELKTGCWVFSTQTIDLTVDVVRKLLTINDIKRVCGFNANSKAIGETFPLIQTLMGEDAY